MAVFEQRAYRVRCQLGEMVSFTARVKESDLWLLAERDLSSQAVESALRVRRSLEAYIQSRPAFIDSLIPLPPDSTAPPLARKMLDAGAQAGTGPMAAVAGAIAQAVAQELLGLSPQVVVENGGDLYLDAASEMMVGLWAGDSPLTGRLGIKVAPEEMPLALACSSGTVGHSLSLGRADAALTASSDGALADAAATALGNRIKSHQDMSQALEWVSRIEGIKGALVVMGDKLAAWGHLTLTDLNRTS